ncbi:hypothetical protein YC2023_007423 [Brassica napus]
MSVLRVLRNQSYVVMLLGGLQLLGRFSVVLRKDFTNNAKSAIASMRGLSELLNHLVGRTSHFYSVQRLRKLNIPEHKT